MNMTRNHWLLAAVVAATVVITSVAAAPLSDSQKMLKELGLLDDEEVAIGADGSVAGSDGGDDVDIATLGSNIVKIESEADMIAATKKFGMVVVCFHNADHASWVKYRPVLNTVAGNFAADSGGAGASAKKEQYDVLFASVDMTAHRAVGRRFAAVGPIAIKLFNKYMPRRWLNFYPGYSLHPAVLHRYVAVRYDGFIKRLRKGDGLARRFMRAVLRSRTDGEGGGDLANNTVAAAIIAQASALHALTNATARVEQRAAHARSAADALERAAAAEADPENTGLGNATEFRAFAARPYVERESAASAKARLYHETMLAVNESGTAAVARLANGRRQEYPTQTSDIDPRFEHATYTIAQHLNVLQAFLDSMFMNDEALLDDQDDDELDRDKVAPEEKKKVFARAKVKDNASYGATKGGSASAGAMM